MKHLNEYINESLDLHNKKELEKVIKRLKKLGGIKNVQDKLTDNGEELNKDVQTMLDAHDEYMEDVMWCVLNSRSVEYAIDTVIDMAEENQRENGTEPYRAIEFLEQLADYLKA